jgi:hypothetical protein
LSNRISHALALSSNAKKIKCLNRCIIVANAGVFRQILIVADETNGKSRATASFFSANFPVAGAGSCVG